MYNMREGAKMEEQQKPVNFYYNTINGGYVPEIRPAGTDLSAQIPYGQGAYLSLSPNAALGVDYTQSGENEWKMQDCVRLGDEYYTFDQFVKHVAATIGTKDVELVRSTLDIVRQRALGEIDDIDVNALYDKLNIPRYDDLDERHRIVDTIVFSHSASFSSATHPELSGFLFEPREVMSGCFQTFKGDVHTLGDIVNGVGTLEQYHRLEKYGSLGAFYRICNIGDIDRVDVTTEELDKFINAANNFINSVKDTALLENADSTRVTDKFQRTVDLITDYMLDVGNEPHPELEEKLSQYSSLHAQRMADRKAHEEVLSWYRAGKRPPLEVRQKLPTLPEQKRVIDELVRVSKELVDFYITEYPIADVYRALTHNVPEDELSQRVQKIQEVLDVHAFAVPVITQDMLEPTDDALRVAEYVSDGKSKMTPNKAMEIQIVVLNPEKVKPQQRMGVDTKGKWMDMENESDCVFSRTSTTRYPKGILASLDKMELFQPMAYQGKDCIAVNPETARQVSDRERSVLVSLLQKNNVDIQPVTVNGEERYIVTPETRENFEKVKRIMRRAHLESKNLPRGVVPGRVQSENA